MPFLFLLQQIYLLRMWKFSTWYLKHGKEGWGRVLASISCQSESRWGKDESLKFERGSLKSKIAISGLSGVIFFTAPLHWFIFPPNVTRSALPQCRSGFWWVGGHHSEIKESKDQADRLKSGVNCVNLTNFAPLDMIKKPTSLTKIPVIAAQKQLKAAFKTGSLIDDTNSWWRNPFYLQKLWGWLKKCSKWTEAGIQFIHAFIGVKGQWQNFSPVIHPSQKKHSIQSLHGSVSFSKIKDPILDFTPSLCESSPLKHFEEKLIKLWYKKDKEFNGKMLQCLKNISIPSFTFNIIF